MVDFNNDTTISTPPGEVIKIVILERREQVIEAFEVYYSKDNANINTELLEHTIRARVVALWLEIQAMARRRLKNARGTEEEPTFPTLNASMKEIVKNNNKEIDDAVSAWEWMNFFIDDMGLTYIDSRPRYNREIIEEANFKKGV